MHILGLATAALAASQGGATPPDGAATAVVVTGVDTWAGDGGVVVEGRLGAGVRWRPGPLSLSAAYGGRLEMLPGLELGWLDAHVAVVRLEGRGRPHAGVTLAGQGGVLVEPAWGEGLAALTLVAGVGADGWLEVQAGPLFRGDASVSAAGLLASGTVGFAGSGVHGTLRAAVRGFFGRDLPVAALDLDGRLGTYRGGALDVAVKAGASLATAPGPEEPVAGLPAAGTLVTRGGLVLSVPVSDFLSLQAEVDGELGWGTVPYARARALVGVALHPRPPPRIPPERTYRAASGVRLVLDAPRASTVAVAGSFGDWQA
ncbi:MAG: hypothetical protein JRI25_28205, partial [Deltaproteobacteria bacterium]|nr:hypothetical protein [Deltaproteobacteria bacterium]